MESVVVVVDRNRGVGGNGPVRGGAGDSQLVELLDSQSTFAREWPGRGFMMYIEI